MKRVAKKAMIWMANGSKIPAKALTKSDEVIERNPMTINDA
ncbi:hypothetical protein FNO01nite_33860 [Flavobacterium noncentrifugens]|nr:hypothetical protein FNO01nite_33860 [Flavobacterium noncentrifugens]